LIQKYSTYTFEEEFAVHNHVEFSEVRKDVFSLKYHIDKRKELESKGIQLPPNLKGK
jgi:hypothetical protein